MKRLIACPSYRHSINNHSSLTLRTKIYMFVIIAGLIQIFFPFVAHADLFGNELQDVYVSITENVDETNKILEMAFKFSATSPYDVVNGLLGETSGSIAIQVRNASKTMALIVATLLLFVDFFRKSINFEWSSKWENVLLFLIKIIVIKQVVQNADVIVGYLYAGFQSINNAASAHTIKFLPYGDLITYTADIEDGIIEQASKGWWDFWYDRSAGSNIHTYTYKISPDAVKMFYPDAQFPADITDLTNFNLPNPTTRPNYMPTLDLVLWQPYFLVMKAIAYIIFVIVIGRVFELSVYTIFAPLPLATFASETSQDVAKSFIKNYIATVIQVAVIVVMFIVYVAVNKYFDNSFVSTRPLQIIALISLALGVTKSGTWARRICGTG